MSGTAFEFSGKRSGLAFTPLRTVSAVAPKNIKQRLETLESFLLADYHRAARCYSTSANPDEQNHLNYMQFSQGSAEGAHKLVFNKSASFYVSFRKYSIVHVFKLTEKYYKKRKKYIVSTAFKNIIQTARRRKFNP